jgi:4-hydroxybenzoate polyprenyltransferase
MLISERTDTLLSMLRLLVIATRPREWIKNSFLFAALFFSENLLSFELLPKVLLAFGLYCLTAGRVYLLNDIRDRHEDRKHPQKSTRPCSWRSFSASASGGVS